MSSNGGYLTLIHPTTSLHSALLTLSCPILSCHVPSGLNTFEQRYPLFFFPPSFSLFYHSFFVQTTLELELDKRGGKNFGPPNGKRMTVFIDDMSQPERNEWDDQPTLELVRQLVETGGVCFLDKDKRGDIKSIEDLQFISAMGHPGGGRQDVPNRLKRHFFTFNLTLPSSSGIYEIYGQMIRGRFVNVSPPMQLVAEALPSSTIKIWTWMRSKMLPSPTKFHYTFNLRDLSRVFQGVLRTQRASVKSCHTLLQLWRHECSRVFSDKLTNLEDKAAFSEQLNFCTQDLLTSLENTDKEEMLSVRLSVTTQPPLRFGSKQSKKNILGQRKVVDTDALPSADDVIKEEEVRTYIRVQTFMITILHTGTSDDATLHNLIMYIIALVTSLTRHLLTPLLPPSSLSFHVPSSFLPPLSSRSHHALSFPAPHTYSLQTVS